MVARTEMKGKGKRQDPTHTLLGGKGGEVEMRKALTTLANK